MYRVEHINGLKHAISDIRPGRCVGNTTRQVNDTIDLLFSLPEGAKHVGFRDHANLQIADKYMRSHIRRRLECECRCVIVEKFEPELGLRQVIVGKNYIKALNF